MVTAWAASSRPPVGTDWKVLSVPLSQLPKHLPFSKAATRLSRFYLVSEPEPPPQPQTAEQRIGTYNSLLANASAQCVRKGLACLERGGAISSSRARPGTTSETRAGRTVKSPADASLSLDNLLRVQLVEMEETSVPSGAGIPQKRSSLSRCRDRQPIEHQRRRSVLDNNPTRDDLVSVPKADTLDAPITPRKTWRDRVGRQVSGSELTTKLASIVADEVEPAADISCVGVSREITMNESCSHSPQAVAVASLVATEVSDRLPWKRGQCVQAVTANADACRNPVGLESEADRLEDAGRPTTACSVVEAGEGARGFNDGDCGLDESVDDGLGETSQDAGSRRGTDEQSAQFGVAPGALEHVVPPVDGSGAENVVAPTRDDGQSAAPRAPQRHVKPGRRAVRAKRPARSTRVVQHRPIPSALSGSAAAKWLMVRCPDEHPPPLPSWPCRPCCAAALPRTPAATACVGVPKLPPPPEQEHGGNALPAHFHRISASTGGRSNPRPHPVAGKAEECPGPAPLWETEKAASPTPYVTFDRIRVGADSRGGWRQPVQASAEREMTPSPCQMFAGEDEPPTASALMVPLMPSLHASSERRLAAIQARLPRRPASQQRKSNGQRNQRQILEPDQGYSSGESDGSNETMPRRQRVLGTPTWELAAPDEYADLPLFEVRVAGGSAANPDVERAMPVAGNVADMPVVVVDDLCC